MRLPNLTMGTNAKAVSNSIAPCSETPRIWDSSARFPAFRATTMSYRLQPERNGGSRDRRTEDDPRHTDPRRHDGHEPVGRLRPVPREEESGHRRLLGQPTDADLPGVVANP
jgi:hypothetical protein